jgi:hypothetical protein
VLHSFCIYYNTVGCNDGKYPLAGLVFDQQGALYGTASHGGDTGNGYGGSGGVVFKLTPPAAGETEWTETVPHSFNSGTRGSNPAAALIIDQQGALYGTTVQGGDTAGGTSGEGVVFKLTPPPQEYYKWTETVLFDLGNSANPDAALIRYQGALYGTTVNGGHNGIVDCINLQSPTSEGCGTVFKVTLSPESTGPRGDHRE